MEVLGPGKALGSQRPDRNPSSSQAQETKISPKPKRASGRPGSSTRQMFLAVGYSSTMKLLAAKAKEIFDKIFPLLKETPCSFPSWSDMPFFFF